MTLFARTRAAYRNGRKIGRHAAEEHQRGTPMREAIEIAKEQAKRDARPPSPIVIPGMSPGPIEELYVAVVHRENGDETIALWTVAQTASDGNTYPALTPIVAKSREDMDAWTSAIKAAQDIYDMDGANEDIEIRCFSLGEFVEWMRIGAEPKW